MRRIDHRHATDPTNRSTRVRCHDLISGRHGQRPMGVGRARVSATCLGVDSTRLRHGSLAAFAGRDTCDLSVDQGPAAARGFSLFEVVIALAIFAVSIAAIGQLVSSGARGAIRARLESQAILRCESKLAELVAGAATLQSVSATPFTDDPSWSWNATVGDGPYPGLYLVRVTVSHPSSGQLSDPSYSISRLVRDPAATLQMTQEQATQQQSSQSTSSSSSTSSGSSSGGIR